VGLPRRAHCPDRPQDHGPGWSEIDASTVSQGGKKERFFLEHISLRISYIKQIMFHPCVKCLVGCPHGFRAFCEGANKEWQHRNIQFKVDSAEHWTNQHQLLHLNISNSQQYRVNTKSILIIQVLHRTLTKWTQQVPLTTHQLHTRAECESQEWIAWKQQTYPWHWTLPRTPAPVSRWAGTCYQDHSGERTLESLPRWRQHR
jgi:hypothetical protein